MGWDGSGGGEAATFGLYYFFGGMLQIVGSLLEWFIGNTFPFIVFGSLGTLHNGLVECTHWYLLGAFWLVFAATLTPFYNAESAFTTGATTAVETTAAIASFEASLSIYSPLSS
jgi:succinate-acetate transporter protein